MKEGGAAASRSRRDVEAEHHSALVMFGDMAVRHPDAGVGDVEQDIHRLPGSYEHGVLPHEVLLCRAVPCEHDEPASPMDMKRVVHRVVGVHLVDQPQLDLIADAEVPVDRVVGGTGVSIDYRAYHPHPVAPGAPSFFHSFALTVVKGIGGGSPVSASGYTEQGKPPALVAVLGTTIGALLGPTDTRCAFAVTLSAAVKTTNGGGRLTYLDRSDVAAFAAEKT